MTTNLRVGGTRMALAALLVFSTFLTIPAADAAEPGVALEGNLPALNEAYWPLDDGSGLIATDSSANGWDADLVNGPVWSSGLYSGGLTFDGNDDYLDVDSTLLDGIGDMSVAMWVKPASSGTHTLLSGANETNSNEILLIARADNQIRFFSGESSGSYEAWTVPDLADGSWHHLAFLRDDTSNSLELYLDGVSQGTESTSVGALTISTGGLVFGQEQDSVGGGFDPVQALDGSLDEIVIVDRILTAQEIADLAAPPVDETPPTAVTGLSTVSNGLAVYLSWAAASDAESGVSGYRIYRDTVGGGEKGLLAEVSADELSYVDTATDPSTTYYYEVAAVNGAELEGPHSDEVNETTADGVGPLDPEVLGYWSFDDGAGTVAVDGSSNGKDATVVGAATWTSGRIGGSLKLHTSEDLVDIPKGVLNGEDTVTIAMWTKLLSDGTHALVSAANSANSNELLLMLKSPTLMRFFTGEAPNSRVEWSIPSINDSSWHHVAVIRDSEANTVELFLDGISQGSHSTQLRKLSVDRDGFVLGEEQDSVGGGYDPAQALDGRLDELWLFNRALTVSEVEALALYTPDVTPPSTVTGLAATADGLSIDLTWNAATDAESGISSYRVYRATSSGEGKTLIKETGGGTTAYTDTNTLPSTKYYYEVTAVNGLGLEGEASNEAFATTSDDGISLIGHWELDETEGIIASDSSFFDRNANLNGAPTWGPGYIGGGLHIDPATDWLKLKKAVLDGADTLTVAMWMKADSAGSHSLLSGANNNNSNEILILVKGDDEIRFFTGQKSVAPAKWTVPTMTDGGWHHVAVVRDSVNDKVELFVDGVSYGKKSKELNPLNIVAGGVVMGQEQDSVGGGFDIDQALDGSLDDVRIYDRVLSPVEITALAGPAL